MMRVVIVGVKGRMGQALLACAERDSSIQVTGQVDLGDDLRAVIGVGDVVIDFSLADATPGVVASCAAHGKALVIGTTGHSPAQQAQIQAAEDRIPIVWSANFSTGVNTLFWITGRTAEILGPAFDLEIVEMHHRRKRDAPSGTATALAGILAEVRKLQCDKALRHGRQGNTGGRTGAEIGVHAVRGGDVVGEHTVIFAADGERLELTHKASSRETFANGALRAAAWVLHQPPGIYTMQDVLGLP